MQAQDAVTQTEPQPGDNYTRCGVTLVVHMVTGGEVYGHRYREGEGGMEHNPWLTPKFRISLPDWHRATGQAQRHRG